MGALRTLKNLLRQTDSRVILPFDSSNTVCTIKWGSRNPEIHVVAIEIFLLCLDRGIEIIPVWTERSHYIIEETNRRVPLRFLESNDYRTPTSVIEMSNRVVCRLWGKSLCPYPSIEQFQSTT